MSLLSIGILEKSPQSLSWIMTEKVHKNDISTEARCWTYCLQEQNLKTNLQQQDRRHGFHMHRY